MSKEINLEEFYTPHWGQELIHQSKAPWKILKCGRRWGKGRLAVWEGIRNYLEWLNEERDKSLIPKLNFGTVGPTYEATAQPWLEMKEFFRPLSELVDRIVEDEKKIYLKGDCIWELKSSDRPESILGRGFDFLWITEAPYHRNEIWESFIRPMLRSPGRHGYAIIEGRPVSPESYFETLFQRGQDPDDKEIESWHFTTFDSPLIDEKAVMRDAVDMPENFFRQEYLAQTQADVMSAFQNIDACATSEIEESTDGRAYVIGVDLGKAVDWTVLTVMDKERRRAIAIERFSKVDWTVQKARITKCYETYNNALLVMDTAGPGSPIYDDLRADGLRIKPVNLHSPNEKKLIIDSLALALEKETVHFPKTGEFRHLIAELKLFKEIKTSKTGLALRTPTLRAPIGYHDDCVISLALALDGCPRVGSWGELPKPRVYATFPK